MRLSEVARERLDEVKRRVNGRHRSHVVDALLRSLEVDDLIELVNAQLAHDGRVRASWANLEPQVRR